MKNRPWIALLLLPLLSAAFWLAPRNSPPPLRDAPAETDLERAWEQARSTLDDHGPQSSLTGSAVGQPASADSCALAESLAQGERQILYRGSRREPPDEVFKNGFLSSAERSRADRKTAADADLNSADKHIHRVNPEYDPYVSTTRDITVTEKFSSFGGWVYLILTARGVDSMRNLAKIAEHRRATDPKLVKNSKRKLKEHASIKIFANEQEVLVPGHIPTGEILGAWPMRKKKTYHNPRKEHVFEKFIPNPNYAGPVPVTGNICPPSFPYWDAYWGDTEDPY